MRGPTVEGGGGWSDLRMGEQSAGSGDQSTTKGSNKPEGITAKLGFERFLLWKLYF